MPEKREKKDEKEKRRKKEKKEPVIRTERESVDSSENRAAMADNPTGDPDAPFRYEWGVKLAEEEPAGDKDNSAEKGQRYVTKRLWGVNLTQPKPDVGGAESPGGAAHRNASQTVESGDTAAKVEETEEAWKALSTPNEDRSPASSDLVKSQRETTEASSPTRFQVLRRIMEAVPSASRETTGDDCNAPEEAATDVEIAAWRSLADKSKPAIQAILSAMRPEMLERVSIRPEAPRPKLDVRVVRSVEDISEDDKDQQSAGCKLSSIGLKHVEIPNMDNYSPSKKLHTASAHRALWDSNGVALSVNSTSAEEIAGMKKPKITLTFSTNSEDSKEEEINDDHRQDGQRICSSRQNGRQSDWKSLEEEKLSDSDTSNSSEKVEATPSLAESQAASTNDFTESFAVADKEIETSTKQPQGADRPAREEESRVEEVRGETQGRSSEDSHVSRDRAERGYDKDAPDVATTDDGPRKSHEAGESRFASAKNLLPDSNAENPSDDDDEQYVTDGDYVRVYGDPYPYSKENLDKWRMPVSRSLLYKPIKRGALPSERSTPRRNANDACANTARRSCGSHAAGTILTMRSSRRYL
ncbi:PREDICTED: uncharacterized protein LOC106748898 [Dinoponera quadriceps]|uniref:Uncharacterized protein LOC106748898 n=1 Tax=Dinoponera quadriceps TaxID=609295 RepID=A0A6P3XYZ5_DINQU|nr:PREDICTED: uncharacterized protein LOC106748898 [Dinoponera quadriceps]